MFDSTWIRECNVTLAQAMQVICTFLTLYSVTYMLEPVLHNSMMAGASDTKQMNHDSEEYGI